MSKLVVIDYEMGNMLSVKNALGHIDADYFMSSNALDLDDANGIILPGVGGFPECMRALHNFGLVEAIRKAIEKGVPFLGVCLGLQVLFQESEEFGNTEGLSVFEGTVRRFPKSFALKVPHMGWNQIRLTNPCCILKDVEESDYFYFVHSFYVEEVPGLLSHVTSFSDYGISFVASIQKDNVFATQFHPEKSGLKGLKILKNFVSFCEQN
ncbi:MAG: imidazole glycerol phosphate synthase subunit HisH [Nitrospinota bacterium]|nr:imidazole glycerol phosphate synthase subunit HisH [Nitrospinota bacterium]